MDKHLLNVKVHLYLNLIAAYRGWWCWHRVICAKDVDNTAIILFPSNDMEINYLGLLYLDQMLDLRKFDNAIILTDNEIIKKSSNLFSNRILNVLDVSRRNIDDLIQFYCLYEFDKRFIVASIDDPHGRNGSRMLGKKGITKEEIFVIGIYKLYPIKRPKRPCYCGSDNDIIKFLSKGELL